MTYSQRRIRTAILLLLPAILAMMGTIVLPLLNGVRLSFYKYSLTNPEAGERFFALRNFQRLLTIKRVDFKDAFPFIKVRFADKLFWESLGHTLVYAFGVMIISFVIGFILALLLNRDIRLRGFFRTLFFLPWVTPSVVVSLLAMWMFNQSYGVVNYVLQAVGLIREFLPWLQRTDLAMWTVIMVTVWKTFPFMMIMLLAGLQTISQEQIDAARIDGANSLQVFRHVTLPNLREIIMIVTLLDIIWEFQDFTFIWILTRGGPVNATTTWPIYVYRTAFKTYEVGYASAIGTLWLIALAIFSVLYIRIVGVREE
ncbi:MAG: carbohydrate ABC transporter permease [Anaerolineae bacterium]